MVTDESAIWLFTAPFTLRKKGRKETIDTIDTVLNSSKTALKAAGTRYAFLNRSSMWKNHSSYRRVVQRLSERRKKEKRWWEGISVPLQASPLLKQTPKTATMNCFVSIFRDSSGSVYTPTVPDSKYEPGKLPRLTGSHIW